MKPLFLALIISLCFVSAGGAQKRKQTVKRPPAREKTGGDLKPAAPSLGSPIAITTKSGDRISGELLDLTVYSVRIRSGNLESAISLDSISSIAFGSSPVKAGGAETTRGPASPDFPRDRDSVIQAFQSLSSEIKSGVDYTEYGRQLVELRQQAERFIEKYSVSNNQGETRAVALMAGALTDYTWARTIWTLKLGRSNDGLVAESDSPAVADALAQYADIRTAAASGNKYSADKVVAGLWKKAVEKVEAARSNVSQTR